MRIISQGIETTQLYEFLRHERIADERLIQLTQTFERMVLEYRPNAKLLLTTNKQGRTTHAAIYDAPLTLNALGQFRPIQQHAPQLASKRVDCKGLLFESLRLQIMIDLWLDCLLRTARETPALATTIRQMAAEHNEHLQNTTRLQ